MALRDRAILHRVASLVGAVALVLLHTVGIPAAITLQRAVVSGSGRAQTGTGLRMICTLEGGAGRRIPIASVSRQPLAQSGGRPSIRVQTGRFTGGLTARPTDPPLCPAD